MSKSKITRIGILMNRNYYASKLAGEYLEIILKKKGYRTKIMDFKDIVHSKYTVDCIFNVFYGELGDGGIISGILEHNNVKFIGNKQLSCSLMFNKIAAKMHFMKLGYTTPHFWYEYNNRKTVKDIIKNIDNCLDFPILAKPVNGAASESLSFLESKKQLSTFIKVNLILINEGYYFFEEFIQGVELSAGYSSAIKKDLGVVEIFLKKGLFQSNEIKFSSNLKENIIPARLPKLVYMEAQKVAKKLHAAFQCSSFSRTDMIYSKKDKKIYLLEINGNPGLLETSLFPLLVKEVGISYSDLIKILINHSLNCQD